MRTSSMDCLTDIFADSRRTKDQRLTRKQARQRSSQAPFGDGISRTVRTMPADDGQTRCAHSKLPRKATVLFEAEDGTENSR